MLFQGMLTVVILCVVFTFIWFCIARPILNKMYPEEMAKGSEKLQKKKDHLNDLDEEINELHQDSKTSQDLLDKEAVAAKLRREVKDLETRRENKNKKRSS